MADGADRKDADLVVDVRAGNAESFAALYDRWFGPVLGAAQDIVGERAEAARVATDTFQSVWLHLDELADPDGFGAWVLLTSRTFARQRQAERDPSAVTPSGTLFDNEDELRRAVAKVLCRRQVPALGEKVRVSAGGGGDDQQPMAGPEPDPVAEVPEMAFDRIHRYHWAVTDPAPGMAERIRTFRLSPGTVVALAIVLLGSVIWLVSRDDTSEIDGGRPAPLFSPASPTTIDGAAARAEGGGGEAAPGAEATPPGSAAPDPATPAPTDAVAPAESRKVKVATVLPRAAGTTPSRRGTTVAPTTAVPIATVPGTPQTDRPPSTTTTVAPSSSATTASTARTTTTAEVTSTSTTARTTTTARGGSTSTSGSTTTTGRGATTTSGVTTTTRTGSTTTTDAPTTTRVTTSTTRATTTTTDAPATSRPATTSALAPAARVTASSTTVTPAVGVAIEG